MNGEETMSGNGQTQNGQTHDGQVQSAQTISHDLTAGATMNSAAAIPAIAANVAVEANVAAASIAIAAAHSVSQTHDALGQSDQSDASSGDEVRKRPVLNPSTDDHQTRAVGSIGSVVETEAVAIAAAAAAQSAGDTVSSGPVGQIALPPRQMTLDEVLEKEIDVAMSGQMTAPTAAPVGALIPVPGSAAAELPASEEQLETGTRLKAKVQSVTADDVFCEVGYRSPGVLPVRQFPQGKQPRVGEEFLVVVEKFDPENSVILVNLPKATRKARGNWDELSVGQITECIVNKSNKGGLDVTVGGLRAFLPSSQVDIGFVASLDSFIGQKLTVQITELHQGKRNLVVSRRAILVADRKELAGAFWEKIEVGQQFTGTVKTIKDYGAFVDLGGADGFLHIGEMSWTRVKHPSEVLKEGQQCDVVVLSLDREKEKIGLGMRQLTHNPWGSAEATYAVGKEVGGKVTRITDFGAFVELEPGVEGLIHISEMDHQRIRKVTDVVNVGQEIQAQVLEVTPDRQRISLSMKALKQKPEKPKDEDLSPGKGEAYERKRKEPLRGGTTAAGGGGLFGNPGDFKR